MVWGNAASMAVRHQTIASQYQYQFNNGPNKRFNDPERPNSSPSKGVSSVKPTVFFQGAQSQPKMDLLDFTAALLQRIHPTIRRFWQNNAMEEIQKEQAKTQSWLA